MQLLAENLKKLEKSGKLKNWGNTNFGDKLGDKFKSARRSSKKIAGYALSKLGGQSTILRRGKRSPKSKEGVREVHSDTEEGDEMSTSSTPLLQSMSASTHNLTLSAVPPPKPPRTFKTKMLGQVANQCPIEDEEEGGLLSMNTEDDFSTDVLNALKKVSSVLDQCKVEGEEEGKGEEERDREMTTTSDTKVILNGRLPSVMSEDLGHSLVKRSESSPLLSQAAASSQSEELGTSTPDLLQRSSHSIGLQPIAESKGETLDVIDGERLVSSVPLRRRAGATPLATASLPTSKSFTSAAQIKGDSVEVKGGDTVEVKGDAVEVKGDDAAEIEEDDDDLGEFMDESALGDSKLDKRLSMMSVTSAEFYSAASSEANSTAASPDFLRHGIISPPTGVISSTILDTDENRERVTSSTSADEEYFSTPPSSPNPVDHADKMESIEPEVSIDIVDAGATLTRETAAVIMKEKEEDRKEKLEGESEERKAREDGESAERKEREVGEGEDRKEKEGESEEVLTTPVKRGNRKRSLTLSESMPFPVTIGVGSPVLIKTMSKDDNFQTEYHHLFKSKDEPDSSGLATSFSTQDLAEILGSGRSILPALAIETVKEEPSLAKEGDTPSLNEEQPSLKGEEEKAESASMADRSASPTGTCSSLGGSTSPEVIEPVIIPDDVTPDTVRSDVIMM